MCTTWSLVYCGGQRFSPLATVWIFLSAQVGYSGESGMLTYAGAAMLTHAWVNVIDASCHTSGQRCSECTTRANGRWWWRCPCARRWDTTVASVTHRLLCKHAPGAATWPPALVMRGAVIRGLCSRQKPAILENNNVCLQPPALNVGGWLASSRRLVPHVHGPRRDIGPLSERRIGTKSACWLEVLGPWLGVRMSDGEVRDPRVGSGQHTWRSRTRSWVSDSIALVPEHFCL